MTKEQIEILIQHKEIGLVNEETGPNLNNGSMTFVSINGISYETSWDVVEVLWNFFYEKIEFYAEWESDIFKGRLISKLKLYSPSDEDIVLLLRKTIITENEKIESLNNELFKDSDKMNMDLFYPLTADEILSHKFVGDWIMTENILKILKFDLFKGAKINIDKKPKILFNIQNKIDEFFGNERIQIFFEIVAHTKNILYLQKRIQEIENPNSLAEKEKRIPAPLLALFCSLINNSSVSKQNGESAIEFCKKICSQFNFKYTDRVRQNYTSTIDNYNSKKMTKVKTIILPLIDEDIKKTINNFIDSKKLYA